MYTSLQIDCQVFAKVTVHPFRVGLRAYLSLIPIEDVIGGSLLFNGIWFAPGNPWTTSPGATGGVSDGKSRESVLEYKR